MDFEISRADLELCRFEDGPAVELAPGQALLAVSHFGLTSNNITYAKFGDAMSYWDFFPAPDGWGRMPVWGFADVAESLAPGVQVGTRLYGYLPPSTHLVVAPAHVSERGFVDASPHRAALPSAYNGYTATTHDPIYTEASEDGQMLLRPLFFTSWLIDDFLADADFFGAGTVVLSSASSKTSSGLAFLLSRREGIEVVGMTSARSRGFTDSLGVYDHVVEYGDAGSLPSGRAVYVDMAGDAAVRSEVHGHFGADLVHSAVVGATHHDRMGDVPDDLPGPRPRFFFAPERVVARTKDWGREGLERNIAGSWAPYLEWAQGWMKVIHSSGEDALRGAYLDLLAGRIDPASAHVLSL